MKITAIIQARMTSTRLPGKVLMEVMDRPLLSFQLERLRFSQCIDETIIATTKNEEDDPIVTLAKECGVNFFRGLEHDVLDRYYQAAKTYGAKHIMRLTADCPLLQPDVCDLVVQKYCETGADYVYTDPSFAEGVDCELFSFNSLEHAWQKARRQSEREHVTPYIRNHPELFKSVTLENETDDSKYRITVDTKEDFIVVKKILENLYQKNDRCFTISAIKTFLNGNPDIYALNGHIVRNQGFMLSLQADEKELDHTC